MAGGRPTDYDPSYHNKAVYKLALLGLNDKEMATYFEIVEQTLTNWKHKYPEFLGSLTKGKEDADAKVARALYKRALGFKAKDVIYEDIYERMEHPDGSVHFIPKTKIKTVFREEAPNTAAGIFWLKNRQSGKWRDKQDISHTIEGPQEFNIGGQKLTF